MMIGFDDDEHESGTLPNWATLTEVSSALGIAREAVRSVARRALREDIVNLVTQMNHMLK